MDSSSVPGKRTPLGLAFDPEVFREQGHRVVDLLAEYLSAVGQGKLPVLPWQPPDEAAERWEERLGAPARMDDLISTVLSEAFHSHHPRNLGHQVGPALPAAALLDLVASLLDTGNAVYEVGSPATPMERVVLRDLARRIGLPPGADGILTSGGSLGNLTALLAMRECQRSAEGGLDPEAPFGVLVSSEAHYSVSRAFKMMGWEDRGTRVVPVDEGFRLRRGALEGALREARASGVNVLGVVAAAGSTATGRIDPLPEIADFCEEHALWLHVDAAHAGAFVFSRRARALLDGLERADSIVVDFHKMLLSPSLLTAVLFKRASDSYRAFAEKADYLWQSGQREEWWDAAKRTVECTRPMLGLRAYGLLKLGGEALFEAYIDRALAATERFAALVDEAPDFELLIQPESNILCYRHLPRSMDDREANAINARIRAALVREGKFYIVQVAKRGKLYLRSAVMNPFADLREFEALLEEIRRLGSLPAPESGSE